jgi:fructose-1,6-bisphosphatase/inositol monophosphatase family enzyme
VEVAERAIPTKHHRALLGELRTERNLVVAHQVDVVTHDRDIAELILKEAGGIVTQIDGTPLSLEAPSSVFAANGLNHKKLLAIAEKYKT